MHRVLTIWLVICLEWATGVLEFLAHVVTSWQEMTLLYMMHIQETGCRLEIPTVDIYERESDPITCLPRAWVISSKLGKTTASILTRTQAILLNSLAARRALK